MQVTEKEKKQYLNSIEKQLVCKATQRKDFLNTFEDNIEAYLSDNPNADFEQLQNDMGTPQEIADSFLENESASTVKKKMSVAKWVAVGIAVALLIYAIAVISLWIDAHKNNNGYGEVSIVEESIITDDDSEEIIIE